VDILLCKELSGGIMSWEPVNDRIITDFTDDVILIDSDVKRL